MYLCIECFNHTKDAYVSLCGHHYCKYCRNKFKLSCVACGKVLIFQGNQPAGHMTWRTDTEHSLPGHEDCGTIVLGFNFDRGIQGIAVQLSLLLLFRASHFRCSIFLLQVRSIPTRGYPTGAYSVPLTSLTTRTGGNCAAH